MLPRLAFPLDGIMELRQLRYLVAIAEHGSFSRAAEKVFIAQSALSHQLAQLEQELGAQLLYRAHRGVELTEAGRAFLPHAKAILRQTEDARASVRSAPGEPAGKVVIGLPQSISNALALPLLQAVRAALPNVELELTEELTGTLTDQLRTGSLHLAVLFDNGDLSEFDTQQLASERLCLIARRPDQGVPPRTISLRKALSMPLVLPAGRHGVRPIIERMARERGYGTPHVIADISSVSILRSTLLAGIGHTLLPVMPLKADVDSGALVAVPVVSPPLVRVVAVCASRRVPLTVAATAVLQVLDELVRDLCSSGAWVDAVPSGVPAGARA